MFHFLRTPLRSLLTSTVLMVPGLACVTTDTSAGAASHPDPRATMSPSSMVAATDATTWQEVLEPNPADPLVAFRLVFRTGSSDDPPGKEGLTALTAGLMREATVHADASTLAALLFPMAAELRVSVDKDTTVFSGRAHKDHAAAFARILTDIVTAPRLADDDFARKRDEQRSFVARTLRTGNDELLQREALEALIYDDARFFPRGADADQDAKTSVRHPYAHTPWGTTRALDAIVKADVDDHLQRTFTRDRLVLAVAGGYDDALLHQIRQALERLPARSPARVTPTTPTPDGHRLLIIEKPSAGTAISLGFALPTLGRDHPDYVAMKLAETWFGEHRNLIGHLFHSMREVRGLNYGDYAYVEHFVQAPGTTFEDPNRPRRTQYFSMWIRPVEHQNRQFALQMALWELQRFVVDGIPDEETFARVQKFVQGYWPSKRIDPSRHLGASVDVVLTGQPFADDELAARAAALTRAEVNAAIARHLQTTDLRMVVVTEQAAPLVDALVQKKKAVMRYASPPTSTVQAEDAVIGVTFPALSAGRVRVVGPDALFAGEPVP